MIVVPHPFDTHTHTQLHRGVCAMINKRYDKEVGGKWSFIPGIPVLMNHLPALVLMYNTHMSPLMAPPHVTPMANCRVSLLWASIYCVIGKPNQKILE